MFTRLLTINVPDGQSLFLWGARQTGKSSYLKANFPDSIVYDLLETDELVRLTHSPHLLREEILAVDKEALKSPVIIDEIQKVPELLNEVHWLIEHKGIQFILCGSSARKLKTQSTNLLGGRAWLYHFFPLVSQEVGELDLLKALQHGMIPKHYLSAPEHINDYHQAYVNTYLTDEIRNEGLVRNLSSFARFLDVAAFSNTEMINASNIAREAHVDRVTVQGYFQILIDTMLGYEVLPYAKKRNRELITKTPKFYFFDVGIANYIAKQSINDLSGALAGKAFENFILMELVAYRGLKRERFDIFYWRTRQGLEVDFILGNAEVAIEVKISKEVGKEQLRGLVAFCEEYEPRMAIIVSQDQRPRMIPVTDKISIQVLPWQHFLKILWAGEVIS